MTRGVDFDADRMTLTIDMPLGGDAIVLFSPTIQTRVYELGIGVLGNVRSIVKSLIPRSLSMIACNPPQHHEAQPPFALACSEINELVNQGSLPPAINWSALIDRCSGNAAFALRALKVFESTGQERLNDIQRSVADADFDRIAWFAHALAGIAGMLDAERLCDLAVELDASAHARDLTRATQLADQLQSEMQRCLSEIPNIRARAASN